VDVSERIAQRILTLSDDIGLLGAEQQHPLAGAHPLLRRSARRHRGPRPRLGPAALGVRARAGRVALITREAGLHERGASWRPSWGRRPRRLRVAMELGSNDAIKRAVELGAGVGIVSQEVVRTEVRAGAVARRRHS
jgi:DNA-binding transcriptional LysR family regulator